MTSTSNHKSVLLSPLSIFTVIACLLGCAQSLAIDLKNSPTGHKPIPLPKIKDFQFKGTHGPPTLHGVRESDLLSFDAIESLPPSTGAVNLAGRRFTERDIIGADNRVVVNNASFPYSAIGRVLRSDGAYCSGSLVGDRVVATASHCIPWGQPSISMVFQPDYYDTDRFPSTSVTDVAYVIQQPSNSSFDSSPCGMQKDFALLKLSTALSSTLGGYFGVSSATGSGLVHSGYPDDLASGKRPYQQTGLTGTVSNSVKCDSTGPISTTADAVGGQSGGPLYIPQIKYVIGVLSAGTSTTTIFASGSSFVNLVNWARTNWPA